MPHNRFIDPFPATPGLRPSGKDRSVLVPVLLLFFWILFFVYLIHARLMKMTCILTTG